ncbi:MAG: hypothetical protein LBQ06_06020, partial [Frankiaceae bacterium]|nr:hypothetical protein [Frankiaceae bacterium]
MTKQASPFQRHPLPPPGALRRDTPDPLPEPQIWAALAAVGALFAFFGMILPWFRPEPPGVTSGAMSGAAPGAVAGL